MAGSNDAPALPPPFLAENGEIIVPLPRAEVLWSRKGQRIHLPAARGQREGEG